ncbi:MAG: divalent metal cation transporter, partial [Gemmatimonadetes bacterium]|nr:divalent metal cation transporter [Gemmatimonadota bacterium]NIQ58619.1 divalent metal cation transporter [Gemmatimonadota bacterium]NIU78809.1 divalent metal cation transporter [Gammaproteobacteria bacterium]NIX47621.1 divalent metal cation transporter [Gemmatimonadota bacterium]NIY11984.1 divalent metal cation transporter [Gemmatimonadota bacterium]
PRDFWKSFGPGLLWAAAAIGVSHLVQSTRAGADAGFALAGVILAALVLKYPFFEYGPRYAAATGQSLVEGYAGVGRWAVWLYLLITLATSVIVDAAILLFTGFLLLSVLGLEWPVWTAAGALYAGCAGLLWIGRYRLLDRTVKLILVALAVSTLFAAALALPRADLGTFVLVPSVGDGAVAFAFLLALVGWMPSAVDISVWNSLWTLAKDESERVRTSVGHALLDFRIGYVGTGFMAFAFVTLGAAVMHGSGESFSAAGTAFSLQLVDLYAETLGAWARPFVLVAVLTTMLSTSITVVDGFPRGIARSIEVLAGRRATDVEAGETGRIYWGAMLAIGVATPAVLAFLAGSLTGMVDFATIVAFLTAPILGYLNLRAVTSDAVPEEFRPGPGLRALSWGALLVLGAFGAVYLVSLLR